jgi:hypothetical protein
MFGQQVKLDAKALRSAREEVFSLAKSEISDYLTETVLAEFPDSDVRGPRLSFKWRDESGSGWLDGPVRWSHH